MLPTDGRLPLLFLFYFILLWKYIWFITINVDENVSSDSDDIDDDYLTQKNYGTSIRSPCIFGMCCKNINGVVEWRFFKF